MSGLKNSPFGKRLRAQQPDGDDDAPRRNRPRFNPIFGTSDLSSTPSLDSRPTTSESSGAPESPVEFPRHSRDYGDRFVPTRDGGDMRTSYHLMDHGPVTPSKKNRIIPSELDALKGALASSSLFFEYSPPFLPGRTSQPPFYRHSPQRSITSVAPTTCFSNASANGLYLSPSCYAISKALVHIPFSICF